ncbi:MAG: histidine phosphatase family protein [Fibrobacter sp.]|nr:histidine phosphatase family protein [Fibrobacter sp.]
MIDSTRLVDSVITHTPEDYLGVCNDSTKGEIKEASINGEDRYYSCDNGTLFWRLATEQERIGVVNSRYVTQSAVSDFIPVERVFKGLADDEKLVVILRHAERKDGSGTDIELTNPGRSQSQEVGAKLENGLVDFYYAGSEYLYTHQTYYNIALRRFDAYTEGDTMEVLNEKWFVKNQKSYYKALYDEEDVGRNVTTRWAYEGGYDDAFYDLKTRSSELLEDYLIPALEKSGRRVGMFISHDLVLIPLVSYVSEGRINLKYYESPENHWLNYLAGIAVVLKPDGTKVFYAVKGLDKGTMTLID